MGWSNMETHIWSLAQILFRNEKQYENFQNISAIELHFKYIFVGFLFKGTDTI